MLCANQTLATFHGRGELFEERRKGQLFLTTCIIAGTKHQGWLQASLLAIKMLFINSLLHEDLQAVAQIEASSICVTHQWTMDLCLKQYLKHAIEIITRNSSQGRKCQFPNKNDS
jgi:hypothetical protein